MANGKNNSSEVLILVILEYTLRGISRNDSQPIANSLNPCYTGIYSTSAVAGVAKDSAKGGLNPCYTGIYSTRSRKSRKSAKIDPS